MVSSKDQKLVLQPLDQSGDTSYDDNHYPAITTITVEDTKPDNKVFVETFLIDAVSRPNKKGWKVSYDNPTDFDRRVLDSKNHPLVLFQTKGGRGELIWDHPVAPITTLEAAADPVRANIEFQKKYTIGYARHFKKIKDGLWHATYEIVNERAKKFFKKAKDKGIQLFTSPYIVRPSAEKDRANIKQWALIHNAIVSHPANSEEIAQVKEVCAASKDDPLACQSLFASLTVEDQSDCGFCVEQSLELYQDLVSSHFGKIAQTLNMTESGSSAPAQTSASVVTTIPNPNTNPNPIVEQPTATQVPQNPEVQKVSQEEPQKGPNQPPINPNNEENNEQNNQDKARIAELEKQLSDLNRRYAVDQRRNTIEKLFAPIENLFVDTATNLFDEKSYNTEIKKYVSSNLSYDEIKEIVEARYIKAQAASQSSRRSEKASLTSDFPSSHVTESASYFPYTKMDTVSYSQYNNAAEKSIPTWLQALKKTGANF